MTSLTEFLLARLDEDEAVAEAATGAHWQVVDEGGLSDSRQPIKRWSVQTDATERHRDPAGGWWHIDAVSVDEDRDYNYPRGGCRRHEDARHIARHSPARVLADVEAKRAIVEWLSERTQVYVGNMDGTPRPQFVPGAVVANPAEVHTLRLLAQPHRDHPDFNPSWLT